MKDWVQEQLDREALTMGRPVEYVRAWETVFHGRDEKSRTLRVLVYNVEPHEVEGRSFHESRFVVTDGHSTTGGIIEADAG